MNERLSLKFLLNDSRSRVYLLWAVLVTAGFVATHYVQRKEINPVWFLLSVSGIGYMLRVMPLRVRQMRRIVMSWLVPITIGMTISGLAFRVDALRPLIPYLGSFWLVVMAVGYGWNGLVDKPAGWYWFAVSINLIGAVLCFYVYVFNLQQYLIAAIISAWSMVNLWLFRT